HCGAAAGGCAGPGPEPTFQSCGACTMPLPTSAGLNPGFKLAVIAEPTSRSVNRCCEKWPVFMSFSAHNAATPATCGVAMLVPLIVVNPPPACADRISTPGPDRRAPSFEKTAIVDTSGAGRTAV